MKLTSKMLILTLAPAFALVFAGPALAKPKGEGGRGQMLQAADANKDGVISRAEATTAREQHFARMDVNDDGFLTKEDREAAKAARETERRARGGGEGPGRADTDGDGKISKAEFMAAPMPMFDRVDANGDGQITQDEMKAAREARGGKAKPGKSQ
jgi:Ca2+-binding EF-hand superfamily protein